MSIIDKIFDAFKSENKPFDPATLNDPIALKTDWFPLIKGGHRVSTYKLEETEKRIEISPINSYKKHLYILIGFTSAFYFLLFKADAESSKNLTSGIVILFITFLIFLGIILYKSYRISQTIVFDKEKGLFYKSKKNLLNYIGAYNTSYGFKLEDIYALQIIPEEIGEDENRYVSYELNLILKNTRRKNIIDTNNLSVILEDAKLIAEFLNIPLWDASDYDPSPVLWHRKHTLEN